MSTITTYTSPSEEVLSYFKPKHTFEIIYGDCLGPISPLFCQYWEDKIMRAYPEKFSSKLKRSGGNYYPLDTPPLTDEQIKSQIRGNPLPFSYNLDLIYFIQALNNIKKGQKVLDVGCGFGVMSLLLADLKSAEVTAFDKDEAKQELLEEVLKGYTFDDGTPGKERVSVVTGDIYSLDDYFAMGQFDRILIKDVIGFLAQLEAESPKYRGSRIKDAFLQTTTDVAKRIVSKAAKVLRSETCKDRNIIIIDRDIYSIDTLEALRKGVESSKGLNLNPNPFVGNVYSSKLIDVQSEYGIEKVGLIQVY